MKSFLTNSGSLKFGPEIKHVFFSFRRKGGEEAEQALHLGPPAVRAAAGCEPAREELGLGFGVVRARVGISC